MRNPVPIAGSITVVDATGRRVGFSIQNVGPVDLYYSDDQRLLDSVTPANLLTVGHLLPAATPAQPPTIYPIFANKKIYIRAQNAGGQVETMIYEIDLPCQTLIK